MGIAERKTRARADRQIRIVAAARALAERESWGAVTIRRLADEIEHSQPVLYSHFASRDAIVGAVALEGFAELGPLLRAAAGSAASRAALEAVARAYLDFARAQPALYEAMFVLPTGLAFATSDTPLALSATFDALAAVVEPFCADRDTATETVWAALHGLAALERAGRVRERASAARLAALVAAVAGPPEG
ncbi:MAG: WHG domain-containing protein [Caulobacteraceae bacterium]|nr:WHG domain-containing protein [Caulobacter sp.]